MSESNPTFPWLHWLHHASFRLETQGSVVYIDPYKLQSPVPADIILVTHDHSDHFSPQDIAKIAKPGTLLVGPERVIRRAKGVQTLAVAPGEDFTAGPLRGRAVASYNLRKPMHPRRHANVGFILDLPEGRLYHAGDTDFIEEMRGPGFKGIQFCLLPTGKALFFRPTMGPEQAALAVQAMEPDYAVPMHYGILPGSKKDGEAFRKAVGAKTLMLPQEEPVAGIGRKGLGMLYAAAMAMVIVGADLGFLRDRSWLRLAVNIGVVLVFAAFYFRFLKRP